MLKNKLKYLLGAFVVIILIDQIIGKLVPFYAQKQKIDKRLELLIDNKINSKIIILGSSRALNNYNPWVIKNITGQTCFNLGYSGSNILFHETILDLIIKSKNKPKTIIYNIDDFGILYNVDGIEFRKDVLFPFVENNLVNEAINNNLKKSNWATSVCQTYRHNVNFINSIRYLIYGQENFDYKTNNIDSLGANLLVNRELDSVHVFANKRIYPKVLQINPDYLSAFIRIQNKCITNKIQLILCYPPLFFAPSKFLKFQVNALKTSNVPVVIADTLLQNADYFFDNDHLNSKGANLYSTIISKQVLLLKK